MQIWGFQRRYIFCENFQISKKNLFEKSLMKNQVVRVEHTKKKIASEIEILFCQRDQGNPLDNIEYSIVNKNIRNVIMKIS